MFKDTRKELERLEAELLAEDHAEELSEEERLDRLMAEFLEADDEEDDIPEEDPVIYQNYSNNYGRNIPRRAYNTDRSDPDLDEYSDEVYEPKKEDLSGLLFTAAALLLGIAAVLIWWVIRFL